jgi:sulfofructose kinase
MAHLVCVGIATLDQVFAVEAMPARAEKYRSHHLHVTGGGTAANAAVAAARLGAKVGFHSVLGDDRIGDEILDGLAAEAVDCRGVRRVAGARSPLSAILVDAAGERLIVSYADPALPWSTGHLPPELPAGVDAVLGDTRWQAGSAHFFRLARAAGVPAVLDADRAPHEVPEILRLATHVAFSRQGARDLTGEDDPRSALRAMGESPSTWTAVTNGAEGVFFWRDGAIIHEPAFAVAAADTLGAGDTWHGAFAVRLAEKASEAQAIRFASAAAAIKCTRFGGRDGSPSRQEVDTFLARAGCG